MTERVTRDGDTVTVRCAEIPSETPRSRRSEIGRSSDPSRERQGDHVDARWQIDQDDELHQIEAEFIMAYGQGASLAEWIERHPEHALALTDLAIALDCEADGPPTATSADELAAATYALTQARNQVFGTPPTPGGIQSEEAPHE